MKFTPPTESQVYVTTIYSICGCRVGDVHPKSGFRPQSCNLILVDAMGWKNISSPSAPLAQAARAAGSEWIWIPWPLPSSVYTGPEYYYVFITCIIIIQIMDWDPIALGAVQSQNKKTVHVPKSHVWDAGLMGYLAWLFPWQIPWCYATKMFRWCRGPHMPE